MVFEEAPLMNSALFCGKPLRAAGDVLSEIVCNWRPSGGTRHRAFRTDDAAVDGVGGGIGQIEWDSRRVSVLRLTMLWFALLP